MSLALVNLWFIIPVIIIGGISFFLSFHRSYQDGLFGRLACGATAIASVIVIMASFRGHKYYDPPPEALVFTWGVAIFFIRFTMRFLYWWWTGKGAWLTRRSTATQRSYDDEDSAQGVARLEEDRTTNRARADEDRTTSRGRSKADAEQKRAHDDAGKEFR